MIDNIIVVRRAVRIICLFSKALNNLFYILKKILIIPHDNNKGVQLTFY